MIRLLRTGIERLVASPGAYAWSQSLSDPFRLVPLRRVVAGIPHSSLLDLGCGSGDLCAMTASAYTGVDGSPANIAYARRHHGAPGRRFEVGDLLALDGSLGAHELVVMASVLHHLADDEVRRCLAGLAVVRPGRLLVVDIALERTGPVFRRTITPLDRGRHFRTTSAIRELLTAAGWRTERETGWTSYNRLFPYVGLLATPPP
ncbi:MAG: class I SAM-dependent methyltransferase [Candidatus Coatesbacteria bacterium]